MSKTWPTIIEATTIAMDKLIADGGETVEGVAAQLQLNGITGVCGSATLCVIAEYISAKLAEMDFEHTHIQVFPEPDDDDRALVAVHDMDDPTSPQYGEDVRLPLLLNEVALRFDSKQWPALMSGDITRPPVVLTHS